MPEITAARPVDGSPIETPWGQQVHDHIEFLPVMWIGEGVVPMVAADGYLQVFFPVAFSSIPIVQVTPKTVSAAQAIATVDVVTVDYFWTNVHTFGAAQPTVAVEWTATNRTL